ncbi:helix-turn-helix transcriptional regulator [Enterococcus avium]|jgi:AraC-like DNA-binding protein|uniref:helix-turn-helix transcriptional regulator n=1 Tax=Enterococcus avium TaxID=33945 RepID=UPI001A966D18|nr:AraC family transcriptional regulator [Enterococcus avium]MBO1139639.1 helix-turn-helix transcriptional regulator [Enterococcus avium]MDT2479554.1 AraC family transcriptional regulator [Enterococcus avium]
MSEEIISISIPPFPDFIEGNYRVFQMGQNHPNRKELGYFDLIIVKKGCLFLAEDEQHYEVGENEMLILLPDKHHYSWQPVEVETGFYWLHFYTTAQWKQSTRPSRFISDLPIPELHYHQRSYTLHLQKQATIKEPEILFELIQTILDSTVADSGEQHDIWQTEELFLRFLRFIENQGIHRDRLTVLAEQVQLFLENNYEKVVTNQLLEEQFHLHSNYISKAMKKTFGKTPLEILAEIRLERAKQYLLRSDLDIQEISMLVGFNSEIYFSNRFKKLEGLSPQHYRNKYKDH